MVRPRVLFGHQIVVEGRPTASSNSYLADAFSGLVVAEFLRHLNCIRRRRDRICYAANRDAGRRQSPRRGRLSMSPVTCPPLTLPGYHRLVRLSEYYSGNVHHHFLRIHGHCIQKNVGETSRKGLERRWRPKASAQCWADPIDTRRLGPRRTNTGGRIS